MISDLVRRTRSCRRFYEEHSISTETLRDLVDLARLGASGGNKQPLKYLLSNERARNDVIFLKLGWAGYLKEWRGPEPGARPSAYIIILGDNDIRKSIRVDQGIAAQNILLGATDLGLAGCMIDTVDREWLRKDLLIQDRFEILLVIALGRPKERTVLESLGPDGDIRYWRDASGGHHVPKRSLDEIIVSFNL
ncbi:MAG: nitroreductase family protein [Deltaproteobacteria bacterium]|nr:nitroreductase family protein [Deltaproteobacteria bacterium]